MAETSWREELAWAAGFFDGEGSSSARVRTERQNGTSIMLTVPQVNLLPLERFQKAVLGLGNICLRNERGENRQKCYVWQAANWRNVQAVIAMLWEFLSEVKRNQYIRALDIYRSDKDWGRPIGRPKGSKNRRKV